MSISLRNKNVLVTGGSRGLGAATVERFAAEGCNVVINYLSAVEQADALAGKLKNIWGVKVITLQGYVERQEECPRKGG